MNKSTNVFRVFFVILLCYIIWGISLSFGDVGRLMELGVWLFSFIFIYIPFFLIAVLLYKTEEPTEINSETGEIEDALK